MVDGRECISAWRPDQENYTKGFGMIKNLILIFHLQFSIIFIFLRSPMILWEFLLILRREEKWLERNILIIKRTVARSHAMLAARQERGKRGKWTLPAFAALLIAVKLTLSDAPRAQDNLSKLLTALSAIAAPSAGTFQNLCTFLVRVPTLGVVMVESAVSCLTRARWTQGKLLSALSAIAAPSASTLHNLCTFLGRCRR